MSLPKISFIIDFDGFSVNGRFLCKEFGAIDMATGEVSGSFHRVVRGHLSNKDRTTARWNTRFVHGFKFRDFPGELGQGDVSSYLLEIADAANQEGGNIGYKGGIIERDWMRSLGIHNYINIEDYGCPKFGILYEELKASPSKFRELQQHGCGYHLPLEVKDGQTEADIAHCPRQEVWAFANFWRSGRSTPSSTTSHAGAATGRRQRRRRAAANDNDFDMVF